MPTYTLRGIGPPFYKQQQLIDTLFTPAPNDTKQIDLCCGRGFGKSVVAIDIAARALSRGPGEVGLFLEPDWRRTQRVFLKKWRKIIPPDLYTLNKGEQLITWFNGALLYYGPRNISGNAQAAEDSQLGQDATFVIDDEAAIKCNSTMYANNMGMLREQSEARFYLTVSTPRVGPYEQLVTSENHTLIRGKSSDNPYLPANYVRTMMENMTPDQAKRELEGLFVSLASRAWKDANLDEEWPSGNLYPHIFEPHLGYILAGDIGVQSSWLIIQRIAAPDNGPPIDVAVAEYTPNEGGVKQDIERVLAKYGQPTLITVGTDVNTRNTATGTPYMNEIRNLGIGCPIKTVQGIWKDKSIQYNAASAILCNALGRRRFCLSTEFISHDNHNRGLREVFLQDTWPERAPKTGEFLPKDKTTRGGQALEDTRDAYMYYAVTEYPVRPF